MNSKLIVALDLDNQAEVFALIDQIAPDTCAVKVGNELFTRFGTEFVSELVQRKFKVFLDLKYHDIPNTVAQACKAAADLGVWMVNVHASGGLAMMQAAKEALEGYGAKKPLLIAVTVLTSFSEQDLQGIGIQHSILDHVRNLALLAKEAGLDGVVSSAHEVPMIKQLCGTNFLTVTPGIRPLNSEKNDQVRTMSPEEAVKKGSDYLVIGRPITKAKDPALILDQINKSIL
ncbi:MAG: orotidine-5'-phosphate decarboxylase [Legionella sp.]|jgi:orotidine-5'-phosphate decarboxylase